jgi:hypothetical protein
VIKPESSPTDKTERENEEARITRVRLRDILYSRTTILPTGGGVGEGCDVQYDVHVPASRVNGQD